MKVFTVTHNAATKYVVSVDDDFTGNANCFSNEADVIAFLNQKTTYVIYKNENNKFLIISKSGLYLESYTLNGTVITNISWTANSVNALEFNNINVVIEGIRILHLNF